MNPVAKRSVTALSVAAAIVLAIIYAPPAAVSLAIGAIAFLAALEYCALLRKASVAGRKAWQVAVLLAAGIAALICAFGALAGIARSHGNVMLLYVVAAVKISDMGGFAFGLLFGRHKLCPRISPNKTWEGLAGSVFASCLLSAAFMPLTKFALPLALGCGAGAALAGTAGDLVESAVKRWVGVKDSSVLPFTNGMGGILDMTDSLFFAPAIMAAIAF
ncbi:MAG: phosphatidate cytidylyltransferase [Kiritimatiellae bacterium]|nr:phosphatidate cytidylyltransferase [Kiritimatiellia bacterium]